MTAGLVRRMQSAENAAVNRQQQAVNSLAIQIKRTLTVRQYGAYLAAQSRAAK